jgi:hypothetical protein
MSYRARNTTVSILIGAMLLAGPMTARADDPVAPAPASIQTAPAEQSPGETVDQRIAALHASLAITAGQEAVWKDVAKAMRSHATAMQKLIASKAERDPAKITAMEDLRIYEKIAQADVDGLKVLMISFETLYRSMPAAQKKVADQVFQSFGHEPQAAHG